MTIRVKICGINSPEAFDAAVEASADWIGFVFFDASPRGVTPLTAARLSGRMVGGPGRIGLFVDPTDDDIALALDALKLHALQLYAPPERVTWIRAKFGVPVWRVLHVHSARDLPEDGGIAAALVVEPRPPPGATRPGGLALRLDWSLLCGWQPDTAWLLAGGLTPSNVRHAVEKSGAGAVDVSSGVESRPGVKDPALIAAFIAAARGADPPEASQIRPGRPHNQATGPDSRPQAALSPARARVPETTLDQSPAAKPLTSLRPNSLRMGPDAQGRFGAYGGRFVAETLMPLVLELEAAYEAAKQDPGFQRELDYYLKDYVGRPSPLWFAERLTRQFGGAKIYFKREELNHTGAHKVNSCMGQILLARRMGKTRIIAETGAGQHGVATATVCALMGMPCVIYMGAVDVERQKPNVFRMKLLGAEVIPVTTGAGTLKDAMNEAMRDWVANVSDTYFLLGTVAGPAPYPAMVRDFQSVIGTEARAQMFEAEGRLPDVVIASVGGGSNAMGIFHPFLDDPEVRLIGVEAAGRGLDSGEQAASIERGRPGVLHGNRTYLLQTEDGQITEAHSISAGLDYPGIGPEHAWLHDIGRAEYVGITDDEALAAFQLCCRAEGIIPALECAHALAHIQKLAPTLGADKIILMNLSGRGDKDIFTVAEHLGAKL